MKPPRTMRGFTLLELLIVVVIIGVLAAVGTPMVTGYIADGKQKAAETGLKSIFLMQRDYLREEGKYYDTGEGSHTKMINTELFSGNLTLDESGDYSFQIVAVADTSFVASAIAQGKDTLCINQNNKTGCD